jgi:sulfatase maturation enzyme AslB (radical SAM superfamily)
VLIRIFCDKDYDMDSKKSFCAYLWHHLCVRKDDLVKPCCRFIDTDSDFSKTTAMPLSHTLNSEEFRTLRKKSLKGELINGCQKCYQQEASGHMSLRSLANKKWMKSDIDYNENSHIDNIEYLELFIGDTCNLKCHTCGPQLSTSWRQEYSKLGWNAPPQPFIKEPQDIIYQLKNLKEIKFVGGEPFLSQYHSRALEALAFLSNDIVLTYYTNCSIYPSKETMERLASFSQVNLFLSIDGFNLVNDYIRSPSRWSKVSETALNFLDYAQKYGSFNVSIFTTVSVLNIWSLGKLEEWFLSLMKKYPFLGEDSWIVSPLNKPEYLSLEQLSKENRSQLCGSLNMNSPYQRRMIDFIKTLPYRDNLDQLKNYINQLDRVRKTTYQDYIPELALHLK